ncbi:GNAT family N-acetyltransferase [Carnobacterium gallinarum]|uniref:GNAT family N-acetyltransferase n=1 Tax=Carnobacterium gallinarum TaxID=2749 RepID=UPI000550F56B|nr:GNAT family N-acetyltransferase [Carnobacterium gallinarum]
MLIKCTEEHNDILLNYLNQQPALNLFIIGDIETYGFNSPDQDIWAYLDTDKEISGVLLRYKNNIIPVHDVDFNGFSEFVTCIKEQGNVRYLSGRKAILDLYAAEFPEFHKETTFFAECQELRVKPLQMELVTDLKIKDIPSYLALQNAAFNKTIQTMEDIVEALENGTTTIKIIKNEQGEVVSGGQIAVESQTSGMIVGIATLESERSSGYGSAIVASLVEHCRQQKKSACLFFNNPAAGKIYHRLGFVDLDRWILLDKKGKE